VTVQDSLGVSEFLDCGWGVFWELEHPPDLDLPPFAKLVISSFAEQWALAMTMDTCSSSVALEESPKESITMEESNNDR
jgi:hypothetical protein